MSSDLALHPLDATATGGEPSARRVGRQGATVTLAGSTLDWRQALGGGLIAVGVIGIVVAWFQIAGTAEVWKQLPYLASGGVGGAALIAIGLTLIVAYEHASDRASLEHLLDRFDALDARLDGGAASSGPDGADRAQLLDRVAALEAALAALQSEPKRGRSTTVARSGNGGRRR